MDTTLTAATTMLMFTPGIPELAVITIILGIPVVLVLLLLFSNRSNDDGKVFLNLRFGNGGGTPQDEQILREMNNGLQRMEQRIDALETLLGDEKPKGEQH